MFETSDSKYIAIGTPNDELFKRFMTVLGLDRYLDDPRFVSYVLRKQNERGLLEVVTPVVQSRSAGELEALLIEAGVPCSLVNDYKELFDDPHIKARNVIQEIAHPVMGKMQAVRNPVLFDANSPTIRLPAPLLGQHSAEILRELGHSDVAITEFAKAGVVMLAK